MVRPSRAHRRGVSRSSRTWSAGCDGRMGDAREFFVRTNGADADAKACGPGLPTLRPSRAVTSRAMTGARKPGSRGERAISVKTVAQGMPDDPAEPVVPSPCFFHCTGAMGEAVARHSLRPLRSEGTEMTHNSGASAPRERGCSALLTWLRSAMRRSNPEPRVGLWIASLTPATTVLIRRPVH